MSILKARNGESLDAPEMGMPTVSYANEVTSHTIPRQAPTSNHIQPQSRRISVTLRIIALKTRLDPGILSFDPFDEAKAFFERNRTQRFEYTSNRIGYFPSVALVSWEFARGSQGHIDIPVELIEIREAEVEFAAIPPERRRKPKDEPPKDKGDAALQGKKYVPQTEALRFTTLVNEGLGAIGVAPIVRSDLWVQGNAAALLPGTEGISGSGGFYDEALRKYNAPALFNLPADDSALVGAFGPGVPGFNSGALR